MWTSREKHAVAAYGNYMYVSGGFASRLFSLHTDCGDYACGDTDASAYRFYLSDVWRSPDGNNWVLITPSAGFAGRGSHQMLSLMYQGEPYLWVLGGTGGSNEWDTQRNSVVFFNDIWMAPLSGDSPVNVSNILAITIIILLISSCSFSSGICPLALLTTRL